MFERSINLLLFLPFRIRIVLLFLPLFDLLCVSGVRVTLGVVLVLDLHIIINLFSTDGLIFILDVEVDLDVDVVAMSCPRRWVVVGLTIATHDAVINIIK